jgi:hypothetical protein
MRLSMRRPLAQVGRARARTCQPQRRRLESRRDWRQDWPLPNGVRAPQSEETMYGAEVEGAIGTLDAHTIRRILELGGDTTQIVRRQAAAVPV